MRQHWAVGHAWQRCQQGHTPPPGRTLDTATTTDPVLHSVEAQWASVSPWAASEPAYRSGGLGGSAWRPAPRSLLAQAKDSLNVEIDAPAKM